MKTASIKEIKDELGYSSSKELIDLCLSLARFKKENKELLTYLLFSASNEQAYIESVKAEMDERFEEINTSTYYFIKKSSRKILRNTKKYIRYSKKKETEVELLLYFCSKLVEVQPSIKNNVTLTNLFDRQINGIRKTMSSLHEDLQYDYEKELSKLGS